MKFPIFDLKEGKVLFVLKGWGELFHNPKRVTLCSKHSIDLFPCASATLTKEKKGGSAPRLR